MKNEIEYFKYIERALELEEESSQFPFDVRKFAKYLAENNKVILGVEYVEFAKFPNHEDINKLVKAKSIRYGREVRAFTLEITNKENGSRIMAYYTIKGR